MAKHLRVALLWTLYKPLVGQKILPSLSLAYLAKVLESRNITVNCIDCNLLVYDKWGYGTVTQENKDKILWNLVKETEATKPAVLGIGYWTEGVSFVREFIRLIKKRNPKLIIIVGGPSATFLTEQIFAFIPEIDYIVRGEGEVTLLELVQKLSIKAAINNVLGVSYKNGKGRVIHNPNRPLIKNLDSLPLIDYENFVYLGKHDGLSILTSRGCPFGCRYCSDSNFYGCYRTYSPAYVAKQIRHLIKLYRVKYVALSDDNVIISPLRAMKLFGYLAAENLPCELPASARADCLAEEEVVKVLKLAKVPWLTIGLENIVPRILSYYQRTPDPGKYLVATNRALRLVEKYQLRAAFNFVLGSPIETKKEIDLNLSFMRELSAKDFVIYASMLRLVPGSYFWYQYLAKKIAIFSLPDINFHFSFDEPYLDVEWICPENFAFVHQLYSRQEFVAIYQRVMAEIAQLKRVP